MLILAGIACLASCTEVQRHRTLRFFFDGVPPLAGDQWNTGEQDTDSPGDPRRRPETYGSALGGSNRA